MPRRPRVTTQYKTMNRKINLETLKKEAIRKEKGLWPSREKMQLILEDFLPEDIRGQSIREEYLYQLENALKTRTAQAFPVGSKRGLWFLETLQKLGFVVETGLSGDKKWALILSIKTPFEIRKEQKELALPRTITTRKPKTPNPKPAKPAKPETQKKEPKAQSQTKTRTPAAEEAMKTLLEPLTEMIMENPHIKDKEKYLRIVQSLLQGRSCLGIAFTLRIDERIAIEVRRELLDRFINIAKVDRKYCKNLLQTSFFKACEYSTVSERFRSSCVKDVDKAEQLKNRLE